MFRRTATASDQVSGSAQVTTDARIRRDFFAETRPEMIYTLVQRLYRKEFPAGRRDHGEIGSWIASLPHLLTN